MLWIFHIVGIVENNKSVFFPDIINIGTEDMVMVPREYRNMYVVWFCGIYMCIKVAVSFFNVVELYKPTAEFVFCLESGNYFLMM